MRRLAVLRAIYGLFLLVASDAIVEQVNGECSSSAATVGRVLGARHLAQALVLGRTDSKGWLAFGAGLDVLHALSMAVLVGFSRRHRRLAALDAVVASTWAASGWLSCRRQE